MDFTLSVPDLAAERLGNTDTPGVWHFDSGVPGRTLMLSALVHGNEPVSYTHLTLPTTPYV